MTTRSTILQPDTLEKAIQTVIRDGRVPRKLRTALEVYLAQSNKHGMGTMRSETDTTCVRQIISSSAEPYPCNDSCLLSCESIVLEQGRRITMKYNEQSLEWSLDINGKRYERLTSQDMEALIECDVIATEILLMRESRRRPQ
jgi:hypothetical protein